MKLSAAEFFQKETQDVAIEPRHPQQPFPLHDHDFNEIVVVLSGSGWHEINNIQDILSIGDVIYIKSHDRHKFFSVKGLCLFNILYRPDFLSENSMSLSDEIFSNTDRGSGSARWRISENGLHDVRPLIEKLRLESCENRSFSKIMTASLFVQLNVVLLRNRIAEPSRTRENADLSAAISYMREHFIEIVHTEDVARQFGYSPSNFNRKFKFAVGTTPHNFLMELRIARAMREMYLRSDSITDIAFGCGFNDSNYFSSCFRNVVGISPTQYRKQSGIAR